MKKYMKYLFYDKKKQVISSELVHIRKKDICVLNL